MPTRPVAILPSILAADLGMLREEVASIENHADGIQIDVMDGHFVPNLSFGAPIMKWLRTPLFLDVHLMVSNPSARIAEFLKAGAGQITFHAEAVLSTADRRAMISEIRNGGALAGIAVNPSTPLSAIADVENEVDLVLVMSVVPGFGGQAFMPEVLDKVRTLREKHPDLRIQMDGGIDAKTAPLCIAAGADSLVAGTSVFSAADRGAAIASLRA